MIMLLLLQLAAGNYVKPVVFHRVDPSTEIWREEVFGPVLCKIHISPRLL